MSRNGVQVEIYEASAHVGGMARSMEVLGQTVDCGPHRFFTKHPLVKNFFKEVIEEDYVKVRRLTRIYYRGKFFDYPLKLGNVLSHLRKREIFKILWSYAYQKLSPQRNPRTLEAWVTNKFGKELYNIFFKNYSEKLWGISCARIDADWAAQRIKSLSLWEASKQILSLNKNEKHHSLVEEFDYPKKGSGMLYEKAKQVILKNGGHIHLNSPVQASLLDNKTNTVTGVRLNNGKEITAEHVISTMPLTTLIKSFEAVPQPVEHATEQLYFRNTILVYLEIDSDQLFEDNWIYVHSPEVKHGRITNFRNWSPYLYGDKKTSILCMEFWTFTDEDLWKEQDEIIVRQAERELLQTKLLPPNAKILETKVIRVPKCYPVYELGYQEHLQLIKEFLDRFKGLSLIGRYGAFKYNNQDHSILMGLLAARNLLGKENTDLWGINADQEYQEEYNRKN
ncbi:protoporphyrinogen oxidase [Catalinimonas alkaloidigena]|nr:protoporphyrinogen oxidase [Catalinimonas alkaloidigena]